MGKIAGIDGSTNKTGIAIFEDGVYIEHVLLDFHKITNADIRIPKMMTAIKDYLDEHPVDKIIMEKSVFKTNIDTVQKLSMLSGAVMFYSVMNGIEFENPVASIWRKKCGLQQSNKIKREILKAEAIKAVKQEYDIDATDDECEAILLARSGFDLPKIDIKAEDVEDYYWGE